MYIAFFRHICVAQFISSVFSLLFPLTHILSSTYSFMPWWVWCGGVNYLITHYFSADVVGDGTSGLPEITDT